MYPEYNVYNQYFNSQDYREYVSNNELITLNQAIELIKKSIADEREDEIFYGNLILQAPTEKAKQVIQSIKEDEAKHNQILRNLYYQFTGQQIPMTPIPRNVNSVNYKENLERALFGELNAVVKYRKILGTMPSGNSYTLLMSIMTDELRHASEYNFLIATSK